LAGLHLHAGSGFAALGTSRQQLRWGNTFFNGGLTSCELRNLKLDVRARHAAHSERVRARARGMQVDGLLNVQTVTAYSRREFERQRHAPTSCSADRWCGRAVLTQAVAALSGRRDRGSDAAIQAA